MLCAETDGIRSAKGMLAALAPALPSRLRPAKPAAGEQPLPSEAGHPAQPLRSVAGSWTYCKAYLHATRVQLSPGHCLPTERWVLGQRRAGAGPYSEPPCADLLSYSHRLFDCPAVTLLQCLAQPCGR